MHLVCVWTKVQTHTDNTNVGFLEQPGVAKTHTLVWSSQEQTCLWVLSPPQPHQKEIDLHNEGIARSFVRVCVCVCIDLLICYLWSLLLASHWQFWGEQLAKIRLYYTHKQTDRHALAIFNPLLSPPHHLAKSACKQAPTKSKASYFTFSMSTSNDTYTLKTKASRCKLTPDGVCLPGLCVLPQNVLPHQWRPWQQPSTLHFHTSFSSRLAHPVYGREEGNG